MNRYTGMGRLTRDPEIILPKTEAAKKTAKYTVAIDRKYKNNGEQTADFINCVAFGSSADFAEKYFHQGIKIIVTGRIQTGSFENKDGVKIPTFSVIIEDQEFAESKSTNENLNRPEPSAAAGDGFMNIPDGVQDEGLPFN